MSVANFLPECIDLGQEILSGLGILRHTVGRGGDEGGLQEG